MCVYVVAQRKKLTVTEAKEQRPTVSIQDNSRVSTQDGSPVLGRQKPLTSAQMKPPVPGQTGLARRAAVLVGLAVALVASVLISLRLGRYNVDYSQVLAYVAALLQGVEPSSVSDANVFFTIRAPRIEAAVIIGA